MHAKTPNKEEKQEKSTKRKKDEVTRPQLAMASDQRVSRGKSIVLHALNSP